MRLRVGFLAMLDCGLTVVTSFCCMFLRCVMVAGLVMGRGSVMLLGGFVVALGRIHVMFRSRVFYRHLYSPLNFAIENHRPLLNDSINNHEQFPRHCKYRSNTNALCIDNIPWLQFPH